jgi:hypothetical protein
MSTKGNIYILDIVFSPAYNGAQVKDLQMGVVLIDVIETQDVGMVDKFHYGDLSLDLHKNRFAELFSVDDFDSYSFP